MGKEMMSLQINEDMVKPVIEKQIEAAILANIGNPEKLIEQVVARTLKVKVDESGKVNSSSYYNTHDYLEVITGNAIRKAAQEALQEWIKENIALVKEMVIREMNKPSRQKSMAQAFANACEESLQCNWRFNCDISFNKNG